MKSRNEGQPAAVRFRSMHVAISLYASEDQAGFLRYAQDDSKLEGQTRKAGKRRPLTIPFALD